MGCWAKELISYQNLLDDIKFETAQTLSHELSTIDGC